MKIFNTHMSTYYLAFSVLPLCLFFIDCSGQEKKGMQFHSETTQPRKFQNDCYEDYNLSGKVKTTQWAVFNYKVIGNTDKYYYKGYTDYIDLNFNAEGKPWQVKLLRKSIEAYQQPHNSKIENIVYEKIPVVLTESTSIDDISIDYLIYSKYVDSAGRLIDKDNFFKYFYNKQGDLQDYLFIPLEKNEEQRHFQFTYKYDAKGNWIERILYEESDDVNNPEKKDMVQKIIRSIIYY